MEEDLPNGDNNPDLDAILASKDNETVLTSSDIAALVKFEESSSSSNNTEQESTSTSTENTTSHDSQTTSSDSGFRGFPKTRSKNRNYRNSRDGNQSEGTEREDEDMEDVDEEATAGELMAEEEEEEDEWDDYEENDSVEGYSSDENQMFPDSPSTDDSASTVMHDTDAESEPADHPLFHKEKPKHNWFMLNELKNRQLGYSAKLQSRELFQRRCYGSLYSVNRLELMYKLEEHAGCVNSLNFHPDGSLLASGADDLKVVIWDWKVGKCLMKYKTKHRGNVFQSKFLHLSGDLHIASCARDGQVRLAHLSREEGLRSARLLGSHKGPCHKLIVLPEQPQIILSAGEDGVVLSHDVREPKSTKVVTVREDDREVALYSIHGHPLKTTEFCVSGRDAIVRVYDQRKGNTPAATYTPFKKTRNKSRRNYHVTCAVYNYNGSEILASYSDADVYLFDVNASSPGEYIHQYQGHRNGATIKGVSFFGPKSEFIVSGSDCGHIYFWEKNTEALVQWLLADDNGVVNCLEPHPQLPFICTSGLDWDIKVWVPSCENEPKMDGLSNTVRANARTKVNFSDPSDINESQMLWMLWRHLRNTSRFRGSAVLSPRDILNPYPDSNSSDSESFSSPDDSGDEDFDRAPNCSTS